MRILFFLFLSLLLEVNAQAANVTLGSLDTTYFLTNGSPKEVSLVGNLTNWAKLGTNQVTSAANWVASGTTNSTLPGIASAHGIVATNNVDAKSSTVYGRWHQFRNSGGTAQTVLESGGTDGNLWMANAGQTDFGSLIFGTADASGVRLTKSGTSLTASLGNGTEGVAWNILGRETITNSATGTVPFTINHASGATASTLETYTGGQLNSVIGANGMITSRKQFQQYASARTQAGSMALDFNGATTKEWLTLTGAVTFTFSNLGTNRNYTLYLQGVSTNATITWPAGVIGVYPTVVPALKVVRCDLESWSDNATNVWISGTTSN